MFSISKVIKQSRCSLYILSAVLVTVFGLASRASAYSGTGAGTLSNPYRVANCTQLQEINDSLAAYYKQTGDIDCSATSGWNSGLGFIPIGTFTGNYDGQNFVINSLYINRADNTGAGLFGSVNGATITNIHLRGGSITTTSTTYNGSLVASASGSTISNCSSTTSFTTDTGGGIVGLLSGGSLSNCWYNGTMASTGSRYTGGLFALTINTTVNNVYSSGTIGARGGIAGVIGTGTSISNAYSDATVTFGGNIFDVGGLFGSIDGVGDPTTASNVFFAGSVTGASAPSKGGVAGSREGGATISGAYYDATLCNCSTGIGATPGGSGSATGVNVGNATPNYFKGNSTNVPLSAWNFTTIWQVNSGAYPTLVAGAALTDGDSDGATNSVEAAAPNSGDANNDGTPDNAQSNVTGLVNSVTGGYAVLSSTCDSNSGVNIGAESANSTADSAFAYPLGLMNFTLHCLTSGETATVTQYFFTSVSPSGLVVRKYNSVANTYQAITGATIEQVTIGGQTAIKVIYNITDGGALDQDGTANGIIVDPSGVASATIGAPNTGFKRLN